MVNMTDPAGESRGPGERRLARPPSDRYRTSVPDRERGSAPPQGGARASSLGLGTLAALAGAAATVALGGVMAVSGGLLIVAVVTGYAIGSSVAGRSRAVWIAVTLAVAGILLGQVGLWLFARVEGGVLALPDYLGQTFGVLVPLEIVLGAAAAWWTAR